jgi:NAD(P)-dependent dehydrogenase (short-subunit alcohol dehydrogenase family)
MTELNGGHAGRVAVVTGGSGGIGCAVASRLIDLRASVHILDLARPAGLTANASLGSSPRFHAVDVSDELCVDAVFDTIARDDGAIDYLVHCAGIFRPRNLTEMSADDLTRTIKINLRGAFLCCRAAIRAMRTRGFGSIVLLSSLLARVGTVNGADYAASKGGILGLARSAALEVAGDGIRVNAVSPGVVDTAMPRAHSSDEKLAQVGRTIPLGRIARVDDVVEACLFLLGEDSSCFTGQDLRVNGGAVLW